MYTTGPGFNQNLKPLDNNTDPKSGQGGYTPGPGFNNQSNQALPAPLQQSTPSEEYANNYISGEPLNNYLSRQQGALDELGNLLAQTGIEALAGTVEAVSYLGDWQQMKDKVMGDEAEYTNWLANYMKQLKEEGRTEWAPVYTSEENQSFNPSSFEWWAANGGQGLGSTLSLLIPGLAASKLGKLAGLAELGQTMLATGVSRYAESTMEANAVYEDALRQGATKEAAGQAASKAFNTNWIFALQDVYAFSAINKGFKAASAGTKGKGLLSWLGELGTQVASEGAEEAGQFVVSEEAKRTALNANTDYFGEGFSKRLTDYIQDDEFKTSTLLGALGGGVFHVVGSAASVVADKVIDPYLQRREEAKKRTQAEVSRGLQQEVANATGDKGTTEKINQIRLAQQYTDALNSDKIIDHRAAVEEQLKVQGLEPETKQLYEQHLKDIDELTKEQAKLRNNPSIPAELHKPILLKQLEISQTNSLLKKIQQEENKTYSQLQQDEQIDPQLIPLKQAHAKLQAYSRLKYHTDLLGGDTNINIKAEQAAIEYAQQRQLIQEQLPNLDIDKAVRTNKDEDLIRLSTQLVSTKEKKDKLNDELLALQTPQGIEDYRRIEADKQVNAESQSILSNPSATKEELLQAETNATDPNLKVELAKKYQELNNKETRENQEQIDVITEPNEVTPDSLAPEDFNPDEAIQPGEIDPDDLINDYGVDEFTPEDSQPDPEEQERRAKFGLTNKQVEEIVQQSDAETRQPKGKTTQEVEEAKEASEEMLTRTAVATSSLNKGKNGRIVYYNRITGEQAYAEDIYATNEHGQLLVNTPEVLEGQEVILKLEKNFQWDQRETDIKYDPTNYTVNVYIEGIQKPICPLRASSKGANESEKINNQIIRDILERDGVFYTTVVKKNVGSARTDNTLKTINILQFDYIPSSQGWRLQKLPHKPILGYVNQKGEVVAENIGSMHGVNLNPGIEDRVHQAADKYFAGDYAEDMSGMFVTFRTAPDGTIRMYGLDRRLLTSEEKGWLSNNLADLIAQKEFDKLNEVIYMPSQATGIFKNTDAFGKHKTPDMFSTYKVKSKDGKTTTTKHTLDRHRIHLLRHNTYTEALIPLTGKKGKLVWIGIHENQLKNFLDNKPTTYKIYSYENSEVVSSTNSVGVDKIKAIFDKLVDDSYRNLDASRLNSENDYIDPVTKQKFDNYYDHITSSESLQTKLKGSLTNSSGEDSSYSYEQVSLYLNPFKATGEVTITHGKVEVKDDQPQEPPKPEEAPKKEGESEIDRLKRLWEDVNLKPYTSDEYSFKAITEEEFNWFKDNIGEEFLNVVNNIDKFIALNGREAFGQYYNAIVTLAQHAPAGTAYHEAGHFMFDPKNGLITNRERERLLDEGAKIFGIKRSHDQGTNPKLKPVNYQLRAVEILNSTKAEEVFKKGERNKWDLNKILTELTIPKEQKEILLSLNTNSREELIQALAQQYTYVVEVNVSKEREDNDPSREFWFETTNTFYTREQELDGTEVKYFRQNRDGSKREEITASEYEEANKEYLKREEPNTQIYSNLTVPGGINYTENEIKTPNITPSIKGHAQFSSDQGIGWFRSDEKGLRTGIDSFGNEVLYNKEYSTYYFEVTASGKTSTRAYDTKEEAEKELKAFKELKENTSKARRILEVQSDLFQKGRDKDDLVGGTNDNKDEFNDEVQTYYIGNVRYVGDIYEKRYQKFEPGYSGQLISKEEFERNIPRKKDTKENQFLQLLNKDSNWVSFFIKSIIQDSASKGYEKVLFPTGNTASKVEGHETLEEFKRQKEDRIRYIDNEIESSKRDRFIVVEMADWSPTGDMKSFDTKEEAEKYAKNNYQQYQIQDQRPTSDSYISSLTSEINQIREELKRVETEGFAALKPIYNFYEVVVGNTLKKVYKDQIKRVKDEYGNEWYELTLAEEHKGLIKLKAVNQEEQSGDYIIEEKIMEEWEKFKLSNGKYKPKVARATNFFRRILDMIKGLLGFKSPLEKLFSRFDKGLSFEQRQIILAERANRESIDEPRYKLLKGFLKAKQQTASIQAFASEVMRLVTEGAKKENIDIIDFFTEKDRIDAVFNEVKQKFINDYSKIGKPETGNEAMRRSSYLAMGIVQTTDPEESILNGYYEDHQREGLNPIEGFKSKVLKELGRWGLRVQLSDGTIYTTSISEDQQEREDEVETTEITVGERYGVANTEVDMSDSLSNRVRLFLSTIPETDEDGNEAKTVFGTTKFIDFRRIDANLRLKLAGATNPLARLLKLAEKDRVLASIVKKLGELKSGDQQAYVEFFVKYRASRWTEKTGLKETKKVWNPATQRMDNVVTVKFFDTDRNATDKALINEWREWGVDKKIIDTSGTVDKKRADALYKIFQVGKDKIKAKKNPSYEDYKNEINYLLDELGVTLPSQVWDEVQKSKKKEPIVIVKSWLFGENSDSLEQAFKAATEGINPYTSSIIRNLAKRSSPYREDLSKGAYRTDDNKQKHPINTSSYITEFFEKIKDNPEDLVSLFENDVRYTKNKFLQLLKTDKNRAELALEFAASYREGEQDALVFEDRSEIDSLLFRFAGFHNNGGTNGWFNTGTPADKSKQPITALPIHTDGLTFLKEVLYNNIDFELPRIQALRKYKGVRSNLEAKKASGQSLTAEEQKLFNHLQKNPLPNDIKNLSNAEGFVYIKALDKVPNLIKEVSTGEVTAEEHVKARQEARGIIDEFIEKEYNLFLKFLTDNDVIKTKKDGDKYSFVSNVRIPEGVLKNEKGVFKHSYDSFLRQFFYNDLAWRIEVSKVFQGDLALYKNQDDYYKRQYQLITPGLKPWTELLERDTLNRIVYAEQVKTNSDGYLLGLAQLIKPGVKDLNDPLVQNIKKYKQVNKTDAQSYMTIKAARALKGSLGLWSKDHEALWEFAWKDGKTVNDVIKEKGLQGDEATTWRTKAFLTTIQSDKPFMYADRELTLPDGKKFLIKEQVKDSITVITPELAKVSLGLGRLLQYMKDNDVDLASAGDTVKVGSYGIVDLNQENWSKPAEWQIRKTKLADIRFPQILPDKKKEEISGTQFHKLELGNINPKTKYIVDGKEISGSKLIELYNEYWVEKIVDSSKALKKELGVGESMKLSDDIAKKKNQLFKLWFTLKKALSDRDINENYYDAIDFDESKPGSFTLPLSFPAFGPKFQSILTNLFKKKVINQKSPGYVAVNLADFGIGYSDELKFITNKNGEVVEAEIGLPIDYIKDIGLKPVAEYDPNTGRIHWDKLNEAQQQALQFIIYRIPTSNKSSMLPVRVVKITPPTLNNIVMIPGELTVQQGLDFDVDKSQLLRRVLNKEGGIDKDNVDTKLFNIYWSILTNPAHTAEMLTPLSSPTMEAKLLEFKNEGVVESIENVSPFTTQADISAEVRNKDGKAEIGIASRFATGHTVLQNISEYTHVEAAINIKYKDAKFNSVGEMYDADGNLISVNHGESQQAALDAAKNPLLAWFNVITNTMSGFHTLLEFGVPLNVAIEFYMQPVVREYTKFFKQEGNKKAALEALFEAYPALKQQYDSKSNKKPVDAADLKPNLKKGINESTEHSASVLHEFENLLNIADQMSNIMNVVSVDTLSDMTSIEALQVFLENKNRATDSEKPIYIDERVFDLATAPEEAKRLAAFFKYGVEDAIEYVSQFYPSTSGIYELARKTYAQYTGESIIGNKDVLKKLNQHLDYSMLDGDAAMSMLMTKAHPLFNENPKKDASDPRSANRPAHLQWDYFGPKNFYKVVEYFRNATIDEDVKVEQKASKADITMYFAYSGNQREEFKEYKSTFDAILAGARTSTLRKSEWYNNNPRQLDKLKSLEVGDVITIWDSNKVGSGRTVQVEITQKPITINRDLTDEELERLSTIEGWSVDYLKKNGYDKPRGVVNLRYRLYTPLKQTSSKKRLKYPTLRDNPFLKNLRSEEVKDDLQVQLIGIRNTDAQSDKTDYTNGLYDMLHSLDEEVKVLAYDAIKFSLKTSGFIYGPKTFYEIVPVSFWVETGVADLWHSLSQAPQLDPDAAVVNFIRHNYKKLKRFPLVFGKWSNDTFISPMIYDVKFQPGKYENNKHITSFKLKSEHLAKENDIIPRFIRMKDEIVGYRLYEGNPSNPREFKEVQPLGGRNYTEVATGRFRSTHEEVKDNFSGVSSNPWSFKKFSLEGTTGTETIPFLKKYLPEETNSAELVIRNLIAAEVDTESKKGLEVLLRNVDKINTPIEKSSLDKQLGVFEVLQTGKGITSAIKINPNGNVTSEADLRHVIQHELHHAYSVGVLQNPEGEAQINFVRNITRAAQEAKMDKYEFLAELASNPEFRSKLKKQDLWSRILRAFRKLLGMKDTYDKVLDEYYSILDNTESLQKYTPGEFALIQEEKKEKKKGSKRIDIFTQILETYKTRERDLKKRGQREAAKGVKTNRETLKALIGASRGQAVIEYILQAEKSVASLKDIYDNMSQLDPSKINSHALNSMIQQLESYNTLVERLVDNIDEAPEEFTPDGKAPEEFLAQANKLRAEISKLFKKAAKLSVKRFATFVKTALNNPNLTLEEIEDRLTVDDNDISWWSRFLDPGLDIDNPAVQAAAKKLRENDARAYRELQEELYRTTIKEERATIVDWQISKKDPSKRAPTKKVIEFESTGFIKSLQEYEQWLKDSKIKHDTLADKFSPLLDKSTLAANDDGVHFISPFSKEGRAILSTKKSSKDYPLRQFYESFVLKYLQEQEEIALPSLRPNYRIPSIGRGLLEAFMNEKGLKGKGIALKEQILNNFRERYDDANYQVIGEDLRPKNEISLRYTSKQDGKDGRLSTREVSLDLAHTIPMFIYEMKMRKGLIELQDDLEIGRRLLENGEVVKTERIDAPGLLPWISGQRKATVLESGKFDTKKGIETKSFEAFDSLLRRFLYGQVKQREGSVTINKFKASISKSVDTLLTATGLKLMLFNVAIPITNAIGTENAFIKEMIGGNIINASDWAAGKLAYKDAGLAAIADLVNREKKTRMGRIYTYFNPTGSERPVSHLGIDASWMRRIIHKGSNFINDTTDYYLSWTALGAVLNRFKVTSPEGKEVSMLEGLEVTNDGKVSLAKGYVYKGSNTLKGEIIDEIIQYTLRLYQSATGIRNRMDSPAAKESVIGRLVLFMRDWLKVGLNARYKLRHPDERLGGLDNEGHYVSSLILYNNIFSRQGWVQNTLDSLKTLVFLEEKDPNLLLLPEELELSEERREHIVKMRRANIRKSMYELYIVSLLGLLLWVGWDDEDEDSWLKYMTARIRREVTSFVSPTTAWEVLRSPTVALNTIEGFQRINSDLMNSIGAKIVGEEQPIYMHGPYKGEEKLPADLKRQFVPFLHQFDDMDRKTNLILKGGAR